MQTHAPNHLATLIQLGAAVVVLGTDVAFLIVWLIHRQEDPEGTRPPLVAPRWSLWHAWFGGQIAFAAAAAAQLVIADLLKAVGVLHNIPGGGTPVHHTSGLAVLLILPPAMLVQNALLFGIPAWLITKRYGLSLRQIGLPPLPSARDVVLGIGAGIGVLATVWMASMVVLVIVVLIFGMRVVQYLSAATKSLTVEGLIGPHMSNALFIELFIAAAILAPIGEEMFFRGLVYGCARRRFGVPLGVVMSAAAFGLLHLGPLVVGGIFILGVALALAYEYTGSLWTTMIMHATINGIQLIGVYLLYHLLPRALGT